MLISGWKPNARSCSSLIGQDSEERVAALKGAGVCALILVLAGFLFVLL